MHNCGYTANADVNAARNILAAGQIHTIVYPWYKPCAELQNANQLQ